MRLLVIGKVTQLKNMPQTIRQYINAMFCVLLSRVISA